LIRSIYARAPNVSAVLTYRGNYNGQPYQGLDPVSDATLIAAVSEHFEKLADPNSPHWQWPLDLAGSNDAAANDVEISSQVLCAS
jgi:hypothetical protein